jgi:hypothetical protein
VVVCDFHTWMCDWNYSIWLHALWWGKVYELLDRVLVLIVFFYTSMMKSTATPRGRSNQERFWFLLYCLSLFTCSLLWVVLAILDGLLVAIWHEKRGCRGGWEVLIIIGVWQIWVHVRDERWVLPVWWWLWVVLPNSDKEEGKWLVLFVLSK